MCQKACWLNSSWVHLGEVDHAGLGLVPFFFLNSFIYVVLTTDVFCKPSKEGKTFWRIQIKSDFVLCMRLGNRLESLVKLWRGTRKDQTTDLVNDIFMLVFWINVCSFWRHEGIVFRNGVGFLLKNNKLVNPGSPSPLGRVGTWL